MRIVNLIILGPPGSGKGTISSRIVRDFGVKHISSGDLLRDNISSGTAIGQEAEKYISSGKLVPDSIVVNLVAVAVEKYSNKHLLIDGFPRTKTQAELLDDKITVHIALNLDVPFEVIIDRLKDRWIHLASGRIYNLQFNPPKVQGMDDVTGEPLIQRDDDKPAFISERLKVYQSTTLPILDFYRKKQILKEFEGTESNVIWPFVHKYLAHNIQPLSGP